MKSKQVILPHQNHRFEYYENETIENYWEKMKKLPQSTWTFPLKFNQHGHVPIECLDSKKISLTKKKIVSRSVWREQAEIILPLLSLALPQGGGIAAWDEPVQTPRKTHAGAVGHRWRSGTGPRGHLFMWILYFTWKLGSPPREGRRLRARGRNNAGKIWHCLSADQYQRMIPQLSQIYQSANKTINSR